MINTNTRIGLSVSVDGTAGPYIMVPVSQLAQVQQLLDEHGIGYYVDENAISLDGKPEIVVIDLGYRSDPRRVQSILDANSEPADAVGG